MAASDARPVPRKNTAFRLSLAVRKTDGTIITTWAGADSEVSLDGAAFADCTNEATEIGSSGCGYIDFTAAEMNADSVIYKLTLTNTNALPVVLTFWPEESGDYRADVVQWLGTAPSTPTVAGVPNVNTKTFADLVTVALPLTPTTAGRTLDVSADGEAGLDWANIGSPTTTVGLTGTTVGLTTAALSAIWNSLTSAMTTVGSIGKKLADWVIGSPMQAGSTVELSDASLTTAKLGAFVLAKGTNITGFNDLNDAGIRTAVGLVTSNLGVYLDNLTSYASYNDEAVFQTLIPQSVAVMAKTDQLTFTVPNQVDANAISGGGGLDAAATRAALGLASANLDTQLADLPTVAEFNARTIAATNYFDPSTDVVIVGTNNDKTGYSLSQSFPANFAALGINVSGHVSRVTLNDTTTANTDMRGTDGANTTVPPTVAAIRGEMDTNSTKLIEIVVDTNELQLNQGNWLTATGFSTHSAADIWAVGTRTLTGFGTLVADVVSGVWAAATRTLTAFGFTPSLHADYNAAKTAASQTSVDDLPTSAELVTALAAADDAVLAAVATRASQTSLDTLDDLVDTEVAAIKAKTDNLPSDPASQTTVLAAITSATSPLATQVSVNDLPTNAELATALGTADDAVLAAIAALNNLSSAQVTTLLTTLKSDLVTDHGSGAWTTANVASLATAASVAAVKADTLIAKNAGVVILGAISNAGTATEEYVYGGTTVTYAGLDEDGNRSGVTIT